MKKNNIVMNKYQKILRDQTSRNFAAKNVNTSLLLLPLRLETKIMDRDVDITDEPERALDAFRILHSIVKSYNSVIWDNSENNINDLKQKIRDAVYLFEKIDLLYDEDKARLEDLVHNIHDALNTVELQDAFAPIFDVLNDVTRLTTISDKYVTNFLNDFERMVRLLENTARRPSFSGKHRFRNPERYSQIARYRLACRHYMAINEWLKVKDDQRMIDIKANKITSGVITSSQCVKFKRLVCRMRAVIANAPKDDSYRVLTDLYPKVEIQDKNKAAYKNTQEYRERLMKVAGELYENIHTYVDGDWNDTLNILQGLVVKGNKGKGQSVAPIRYTLLASKLLGAELALIKVRMSRSKTERRSYARDYYHIISNMEQLTASTYFIYEEQKTFVCEIKDLVNSWVGRLGLKRFVMTKWLSDCKVLREGTIHNTQNEKCLCLRIYPDVVALTQTARQISRAEYLAGKDFWLKYIFTDDADYRQSLWLAICDLYPAYRAAFILKRTFPKANYKVMCRKAKEFHDNSLSLEDFIKEIDDNFVNSFPTTYVDNGEKLFSVPVTSLLPDRFVVNASVRTKENATRTIVRYGHRLPKQLQVGLDLNNLENATNTDDIGKLRLNGGLSWMTDYDEAERMGMAVTIPLSSMKEAGKYDYYNNNGKRSFEFSQIFVYGISDADNDEASCMINEMMSAHLYSNKAMDIISFDSATNILTSEDKRFAFDSSEEKMRERFSYQAHNCVNPHKPEKDNDLDILDRLFCLKESVLGNIDVPDEAGTSEVELQRCVNRLMLKYLTDEKLSKVVNPLLTAIRDTPSLYDYMCKDVLPHGPFPMMRIGDQPYGILPVCDFKKLMVKNSSPLAVVRKILVVLTTHWNNILSTNIVNCYGKDGVMIVNEPAEEVSSGSDAHRAKFGRPSSAHNRPVIVNIAQKGTDVKMYGFVPGSRNNNKYFPNSRKKRKAGISDSVSNTTPPTPYTVTTEDYLNILGNTPRSTSFYKRKTVKGDLIDAEYFRNETYQHQIEELYRIAVEQGIISAQDGVDIIKNIIPNYDFVPLRNIEDPNSADASFMPLDGALDLKNIVNRISKEISEQNDANKSGLQLTTDKEALEKQVIGFFDLFNYRLDAWLMGMLNNKLRGRMESGRHRIALGCFGWIFNLKENDALKIGCTDEYIIAPSINQAITGAIMRSSYNNSIKKGTNHNYDMGVNLSSERVRSAIRIIEGIQNGLSLGAILGTDLERLIHEANKTSGLEMDSCIYDLRQNFPLMTSDVENRNSQSSANITVLNGASLLVAYADCKTKVESGNKEEVESAISSWLMNELKMFKDESDQTKKIAKIDCLRKFIDVIDDERDALTDVVLTESVYKLTLGNTDASHAIMRALSELKNIPMPEVAEIPIRSAQIDGHMLAMLPVDAEYSRADNLLAATEPKVEQWLRRMIFNPDDVCMQTVENGVTGDSLTLGELGISASEMVYLSVDRAAFTHFVEVLSWMKTGTFRSHVCDGNLVEMKDGMHAFSECGMAIDELRKVLASAHALKNDDLVKQTGVDSEAVYDAMSDEYHHVKGYITRLLGDMNNLLSRQFAIQNPKNADYATAALPDDMVAEAIRILLDCYRIGNQTALDSVEEGIFIGNRDMMNGIVEWKAVVEAQHRLFESMHTIYANIQAKFVEAETLIANDAEHKHTTYVEAIKKVLVAGYLVVPAFRPDANVPLADLAGQATGKRFNNIKTMDLEDMIGDMAQVEQPMMSLYQLRLFQKCNDFDVAAIVPMQLASVEDNTKVSQWLGAEVAKEEDVRDAFTYIVMNPDEIQNASKMQVPVLAGIVIDHWVERIPYRDQTAAVAFGYDQPDAEAPQTLLLAVSTKDNNKGWNEKMLINSLKSAIHMVKCRTVSPDMLCKDGWAGGLFPLLEYNDIEK